MTTTSTDPHEEPEDAHPRDDEVRTLAEIILIELLRRRAKPSAQDAASPAVANALAKFDDEELKRALEQYEDGGEGSASEWNAMVEVAIGQWELDDPDKASELCAALRLARPFYLVRHEERREIERLRANRGLEPETDDLVGLAFSGGGIRSATFNLGVLQGLADCDLLGRFDYLSTVSGGGYIGAWLATWTKRRKFRWVASSLKPATGKTADDAMRPIGFLRQFSNYLTPTLGLTSADTWTMLAVYVRNVVLNFVILSLATSVLLLLARFVVWDMVTPFDRDEFVFELTGCAILIVFAIVAVVANLHYVVSPNSVRDQPPALKHEPRYTRQWMIQAFAVAPLLIASYILAKLFWNVVKDDDPTSTYVVVGVLAGVYFLCALLVQGVGGFVGSFVRRRQGGRVLACLAVISFAGLCSAFGGGLLWLFVKFTRAMYAHCPNPSVHFAVIGAPCLLVVLGLVAYLLIGLMGIDFRDCGREWFSRFGAWIAVYVGVWLALFGAAIYGPFAICYGVENWSKLTAGVSLAWVATTVASVLSANSAATSSGGERTGTRSLVLDLLARIGPPVFAAGYVVTVALGVDALLTVPGLVSPSGGYFSDVLREHMRAVANVSLWPASLDSFIAAPSAFVGPLSIAFTLAALLLSWRVDVNEFSLHHFYKNRLVRCYLGASHRGRMPNPFTGFDETDDMPLADLRAATGYDGPFPIVNATLNYTGGDQLAWQERKAASFVFTPLYCGFESWKENRKERGRRYGGRALGPFGYRSTENYAYAPKGINVGTAMAISGAAVNPNQGYHTSPAVAFLMTLFDVRLGWWLGNPRSDRTSGRSSPRFGLMYLVKELIGSTDDRSGFVSVSDGGHFENLGIYELVRRHCSYIVACDAEQDPDLTFNGLAGAVRKCRIDFDVEIDIDPSRISRSPETGASRTHCVVGTIRYPDGGKPGTLLYLKSSLVGEEPADVREFASSHPEFPHTTTADQWFDESEFESYRELGYHVATTTFRAAEHISSNMSKHDERYKDVLSVVERLWYPPSEAVDRNATKHTQTYIALLEVLRKDEKLSCLDDELFKGLPVARASESSTNGANGGGPHTREEFYFCIALVQLLEDIWTDFRLGDTVETDNPYVEGWIRLYCNWLTNSATLQDTWDMVAPTYGTRFRSFWLDLNAKANALVSPEERARQEEEARRRRSLT